MDSLRSFRRFAIWTCIATYVLIWVGGLVRVSGAGLGCPDWPKCFGRWVPPTSVAQVPADQFDPALFNVTLAWIEYGNRLIGVLIGLLILAAAILAVWKLRAYPRLVWPTVIATLLVGFQGWLGSVVVSSLLEPWIVTAHLLVALVIISLLIWVAVQAWKIENPGEGQGAIYPSGTKGWLAAVWFLALGQIGLGAWLRGNIEHQIEDHPLRTGAELIDGAGNAAHVHLVLGLILGAVATWLCLKLIRGSEKPAWLVSFGAWSTLFLIGLQVLIGLGFVILRGVPANAQLFHAWVASLLVGSLLILAAGLIERKPA